MPKTKPGKMKIGRKGVEGVIVPLIAIATAVLLYAFNQPFSLWVSHWLNRDSSHIDLRDCAADIDGSLALVPCWSAAAEYKTIMLAYRPSPGGGPHDPQRDCDGAKGWVRAVDTPGFMACLKRIH